MKYKMKADHSIIFSRKTLRIVVLVPFDSEEIF